ncbi:MAG: CHAT domain-containing protein [Leptolyngbyaceae cyanobacterium bins.349]|nr:CHAT domain-containing protein [Leptolyngbyaceae cyanobacterium bins.349]
MRQSLSLHWPRWLKKLGWYVGLGLGMASLLAATAIAQTSHISTPPPAPPISLSQQRDGLELLRTGKTDYNNGQWLQAIAAWQQAEQQFTAQQDDLNRAVVLGNLALAYQQLARWPEANQAIATSLDLFARLPAAQTERSRLAEAWNIRGSVQLAQGQAEQARTSWQRAVELFRQAQDETGEVRALINQTQALRSLGLYLSARSTLAQVNQVLQKQPDSALKSAVLLNYGDTLRLIGDLPQSQAILEHSLKLAQTERSPAQIAAAYISLGNTARAQRQPSPAAALRQADEYYKAAIAAAPSPLIRVQAQLNQVRLWLEAAPPSPQRSALQASLAAIETQLPQLPANRAAIYARINYADILMKLAATGQATPATAFSSNGEHLRIAQLLATAVQQARQLQDQRAESYALGYLGSVYEQQQQWSQAQGLTAQALLLSEISNTPDISYRWLAQLGRLLKAQGKPEAAIAAYSNAVKTLGRLRNDLVSNNLDVQFSFRESVEPIYREFVGLLLQPIVSQSAQTSPASNSQVSQARLKQARQVIESLQLAELDNFFREACLESRAVQIDQIDQQAAVLYPIILSDRLDVILSLPDGSLRHHSQAMPESAQERLIAEMLNSLAREASNRERLPKAQQLYDLLIRPFEADLATNGTKNLVFVLDGTLRNVPMAVLHDGKQYLIEKYNLALTPGMQLLPTRPLMRQQLKALIGGVSEANQNFIALPNVVTEIEKIRASMPTEVLLNQNFTRSAFQQQIQKTPFPIVHLATHGQFSSDPDQTFVLAWNDLIDVRSLSEMLQTREQVVRAPVELLVMSACQTAEGDDRAALGLAGVAVRSGARSTIATLWAVDDEAAARFVTRFYQELANSQRSKAEALRQAQLALLKELKHPFYWAPFILVGNWL